MGSCAGFPKGSWTLASGLLGPEYLEELAFWCGCGWVPPASSALPTLGYTGILRAALGLRPGSVGHAQGSGGHI